MSHPKILMTSLKQAAFGTFGTKRIIGVVHIVSYFTVPIFKLVKLIYGLLRQSKKIEKTDYSIDGSHAFFGYYDKSPFSEDMLLASSVPKIENVESSTMSVGYFDLKTGVYNKFASTKAWSWQQGCRLQWHPTLKNVAVYNVLESGNAGSVFFDVKQSKVIRKFDFPIFDISKDAKFAISLNFTRLAKLFHGYGFDSNNSEETTDSSNKKDGVWLIDLENSKRKLIISILELQKNLNNMHAYNHGINNLFFNYHGYDFSFVHFYNIGKINKKRLIYSDVNGNFKIIEEDVTHHAWLSKDKIIVFVKTAGRKGYWIVNPQTLEREKIGNNIIDFDGHPSEISEGKSYLLDSYFTKFDRTQKLYIYDHIKGRMNLVFQSYIPFWFTGHRRCDFHPRLDKSKKLICIDNVEGNSRILTVLRLRKSK